MTDTLDRGNTDSLPTAASVHLDYDEPTLRYHEVIADLAAEQAPQAGSVADFGCGPGQILGRLAENRPDLRLVGFDGDPECLRRAADRAPSADFKRGDLTAEHDSQDRYDVIVSSHALEHLASPVEVLHRWGDLLTPGGRLIIAVPNSLQPVLLARALVRRPKANGGHYYVWDRPTFENFCRLAGFVIEATAVDYVPLVPVRVRVKIPAISTVEQGLLKAFPQFSNSHIVVLRPGDNATDADRQS